MYNLILQVWLNLSHRIPTLILYLTIIFLIMILISKRKENKPLKSIVKTIPSKTLRPRVKKALKKMISPPVELPIIGHMHLLREYQSNYWEGLDAIRKQYGNLVSLQMGIQHIALVSDYSYMREILLDKGDVFADRPLFPRHHIIFGGDKENSLALCNWSYTHRDRRKLCKRGILPNKFSYRIQLLESVVSKFCNQFVDELSKREPTSDDIIDTTPSDNLKINIPQSQEQQHHQTHRRKSHFIKLIKEDLLLLTTDIFMEYLCEEKPAHNDPNYRMFAKGCDFVFWDINCSFLIDFLPYLTSFGVARTYLKRLKDETDFLRNFIDERIFLPRLNQLKNSSREESILQETFLADNNNQTVGAKTDDYLDSLILEHLSNTTHLSLADYKVGFADLLAGHAAVANIVYRVLGHLALDEKLQNMICEEARKANLDNSNHRPSLPITEASMYEALRLASSPIVPHVAREDTSVGEYFVPAKTLMLLNIYHHNLSEELWTDPFEYNPLRFIEFGQNELGEKVPRLILPKYFMPFSEGLRQCLGRKLVEVTTVIGTAKLCSKFILKANKEDLVRSQLSPKGVLALDYDSECYELKLYPRRDDDLSA